MMVQQTFNKRPAKQAPTQATTQQTGRQNDRPDNPDNNKNTTSQVLFIEDGPIEKTLERVLEAAANGMQFCVHPPGYQAGEPASSAQPCAPDKTNNATSCFQCLSAGSSGNPKRIRRTQASWQASFAINARQFSLTAQDKVAIVGKLSHSLPLYAALEAAWIGAKLNALTDLRPDKQLDAMNKMGTTVLWITPTQLRQMCGEKKPERTKCSAVRVVLCGGGKLDGQTRSEAEAVFPNASVIEFYGAVETSFISISDANTPPDSVGRLYPQVDLLVLDENRTPSSGVGELWVKSPFVCSDYVDEAPCGKGDVQSTGDSEKLMRHGDYISVGELGRLDKEGYLYVYGRKSRMINIADNKVFPEQIESVLSAHPAVIQSVAVPVHDVERGTVLQAMVETNELENTTGLQQELLSMSRQQLGTLKAPRRIVFVQTLPQLSSGKPDIEKITSIIQMAAST